MRAACTASAMTLLAACEGWRTSPIATDPDASRVEAEICAQWRADLIRPSRLDTDETAIALEKAHRRLKKVCG